MMEKHNLSRNLQDELAARIAELDGKYLKMVAKSEKSAPIPLPQLEINILDIGYSICPEGGLYTPDDLNSFMRVILEGVTPTKLELFNESKNHVRMGSAFVSEPVLYRKRTKDGILYTLADPALTTIPGFENGSYLDPMPSESLIETEQVPLMRCVMLHFYPDENIANAVISGRLVRLYASYSNYSRRDLAKYYHGFRDMTLFERILVPWKNRWKK